MSTTQVVPVNIALPARLQGATAAAAIAAANAAAAGGIRTGGFPSISIKANKFHEKEGEEIKTYMAPAQPGQPPLPLMCLEVVVIGANPAISKTYYPGDYVEGSTEEPTCRSGNGVTPDADAAQKQNVVCATCPKNQWGSAVSKLSGKDIKACADAKQLAVLPAGDLGYKALGLKVGKGSLTNWGKYVQALSGRGMPVDEVVTNITFDAQATGVLQFAFNRFLSDEEASRVKVRSQGDDVKLIVAQSRVIAAPALPAPDPVTPPAAVLTPPPPPPAEAPAPAQASLGFGAPAAPAPAMSATEAPAAPAVPEPPKRPRRTRAQIAADNAGAGVDLSYLPPGIQAALAALPADSPARAVILAQYPPPAPKEPAPRVEASPFTGHPPHVEIAVSAAGGVGTQAGRDIYKALTGAALPDPAPTPAAAPAAPALTEPPPVTGAPVAAAPVATGFGATVQVPSAAVVTSAASLKDRLTAKLGLTPSA